MGSSALTAIADKHLSVIMPCAVAADIIRVTRVLHMKGPCVYYTRQRKEKNRAKRVACATNAPTGPLPPPLLRGPWARRVDLPRSGPLAPASPPYARPQVKERERGQARPGPVENGDPHRQCHPAQCGTGSDP